MEALFDAGATTWTQELRLNGQVGAHALGGRRVLPVRRSRLQLLAARRSQQPVRAAGRRAVGGRRRSRSCATKSTSLFGQVEYDLTDTVTLIGGARVIREKKDFTGEETFFLNTESAHAGHADRCCSTCSRAPSHRHSDTLWSGKMQLDWRPADDLLIYAGVNRGVKAGGFNAPATFGGGFPAEDIPYGEEVLIAYEAGLQVGPPVQRHHAPQRLLLLLRLQGLSGLLLHPGDRLRPQPRRQVQGPGARARRARRSKDWT